MLNKIKDKTLIRHMLRVQSDYTIMCGLYCIVFIEYIIAEKTLLDHTNLFSPNSYQKNDKIIQKYFENKYDKRKRKS